MSRATLASMALAELSKNIRSHLTPATLKFIPLNADWFDEKGFPAHLKQWVEEATSDESVNYHGAYCSMRGEVLYFRISRFASIVSSELFDAEFEIDKSTVLKITANTANIQRRAFVMPGVCVQGETLARYIRVRNAANEESWIELEHLTHVYQFKRWEYIPASASAIASALDSMRRKIYASLSFQEYNKISRSSIVRKSESYMPEAFDWRALEATDEMRWIYCAMAHDIRLLEECEKKKEALEFGFIDEISTRTEIEEKYRQVNSKLILRLLSEGKALVEDEASLSRSSNDIQS